MGRAIARRTEAETDSATSGYRARARGIVTFSAEYGRGPSARRRTLKADELDVEVYWERPDRSKQIIRAWRDTTFFPTDIQYHRDHLGIVTNDFGPLIRIGGGDEVRDVPHPLALGALERYEYAASDTLTIRVGARTVTVVALLVRPRDPKVAAVVGTLYLDLESAMLVRARLTFTPASYLDTDLEDISVVLERALFEGRHWLPFRQEIEIRRRSAAFEIPIRGMIRGQWEIGDYELEQAVPQAVLASPPIGGLLRPGGPGPWTAPLDRVADSVLQGPTDHDVKSLRREAVRIAQGRLLEGLPRLRIGFDGVSDLVRVNRVQGLALGARTRWRRSGPVEAVELRLGLGTSDGRLTGRAGLTAALGGATLEVRARREIEDIADEPVISPLLNSILSQETGHDYGDYVLREGVEADLTVPAGVGWEFQAGFGRLGVSSVAREAQSARGQYDENPALGGPPRWVGRLSIRKAALGLLRLTTLSGRVSLEGGTGGLTYGRVTALGEAGTALGSGRLIGQIEVGAGTRDLPRDRLFVLGGRGTLPGEPYRAYGGRQAAFGRIEWRADTWGPSIGLGPFGSTGRRAVVAPFVAVGLAGAGLAGVPWMPSNGLRPVAGVAVELFSGALRVELAQPLRGGRGPGLILDFGRAWWPLL
ncbi:MAG: hypothetical protein ABI647_22775 [Gemmatimonadota bacterium]